MSLQSADATAEAIHTILTRSDYFPYLFRTATQIGFRVDGEALLVSFDAAREVMSIDHPLDPRECLPELWAVLPEEEIVQAAGADRPLKGVRIETSERGQVLHPTVSRILLRCLSGILPYPLEERDELVYGALFGFDDPDIVWISEGADCEVQRFAEPDEDRVVLVTSGLSNPDRVARAASGGRGDPVPAYELAILLEPGKGGALERQFCAWVEYQETTGKPLLLGQYLGYHEESIPGTGLGGFLIVPPVSFPDSFPVAGGYADWHLLLGVTPDELTAARETDVPSVAERLRRNGTGDLTRASRPSALG